MPDFAQPAHSALMAAFAATLIFSTSSVVFARYSREISVLWMNAVKAGVCWGALAVTLILTGGLGPLRPASAGFLVSGALGLGIGDIFLLGAFARIGASRTLMVFGFQPLIIGAVSALLFQQPMGMARLVAIALLMGCLFLVSFERYRRDGHWETRGLLYALLGVGLDNVGLLLSRWSFDQTGASPTAANFIRTTGALAVFGLISFVRPIEVIRHFKNLPGKERGTVLTAAFFGTFLSLSLSLFAIKFGHLASVTAVTLSGPALSAAAESIWSRRWPSPYLVGGLVCLFSGMGLALVSP